MMEITSHDSQSLDHIVFMKALLIYDLITGCLDKNENLAQKLVIT